MVYSVIANYHTVNLLGTYMPRCVEITKAGSPDVLKIREFPMPIPNLEKYA